MPISPEKRALYPKDWDAISRRIREREGNRCKQCRIPNGVVAFRTADKAAYILEDGETCDAQTGASLGCTRGSEMPEGRYLRIVLTVAHLDHDPGNNTDANLATLCQRCHLAYDREQHKASAANTRRRRAAERGQGELSLGGAK